jgi:hypothetical protein
MILVLCTACSSSIMRVGSQYAKTAVIGPSGGSLTISASDDAAIQGTSITIPAGALTAPVTIAIGATDLQVVSSGALGPAIDFEPSGTLFAKPVTMTIPVPLASGVSASRVAVMAVEGTGTSRIITGVTVANGLATFQASGFTLFGGFESNPDGGDDSDGGSCTPSCAGGAACGSSDGCGGSCNANCGSDGGCVSSCPSDAGCGSSDGCGGTCINNCPLGNDGGATCADCLDYYGADNNSCCPIEGTTLYACVNFENDPNNCGSCQDSCGGDACVNGVCADGGLTTPDAGCIPNCGADAACGSSDGCGGTCIDNCVTDAGTTCAECMDFYDENNSCCPVLGTTAYACVNFETDGNNCGGCGNACPDPTYACVSGACACQPPGSLCGDPDAGISLFCTVTATDNNNCGDCGIVCAGSNTCQNGDCGYWPDGGTSSTDGGTTSGDGGTTSSDGGTTSGDGGTTSGDADAGCYYICNEGDCTTFCDGGTTSSDGG